MVLKRTSYMWTEINAMANNKKRCLYTKCTTEWGVGDLLLVLCYSSLKSKLVPASQVDVVLVDA